jgi:hypothetical protein
VSAHKTGTAFTKPVDPVLGQALDAWQAVRPAQPKFTDRRTGELVDLLFAFRARKVSTSYINNTVIPVLCRKAGVPAADVRGNITSHRAPSTIASQLYNAKEPMTLFETPAAARGGTYRTMPNCIPQPGGPGATPAKRREGSYRAVILTDPHVRVQRDRPAHVRDRARRERYRRLSVSSDGAGCSLALCCGVRSGRVPAAVAKDCPGSRPG